MVSSKQPDSALTTMTGIFDSDGSAPRMPRKVLPSITGIIRSRSTTQGVSPFFLEPIERLLAVLRGVHRESFFDQRLGERLAYAEVVVDEKNRAGGAATKAM